MNLRQWCALVALGVTGVAGADVRMGQAATQVSEDLGSVTISVVRTTNDGSPVSVNFSTSPVTAEEGVDYVGTSGTLTWEADDLTAKVINVVLIDNGVADGTRDFDVVLTPGPTASAVLAPDTTTVTILDDEDANPTRVVLDQNFYSVSEGDLVDAANNTVAFSLARQGDTTQTSRVTVSTADGSALSGDDYIPLQRVVEFAPGETTQANDLNGDPLSIEIVRNDTDDGNRSFTLSLSDAFQTDLGTPSSATVRILDDDNDDPVNVNTAISFVDSALTINESDNSAIFRVQRTGSLDGEAAVEFRTEDGTARGNTDYEITSQTLTWDARDGSIKSVFVFIPNNDEVDGNRDFTGLLFNPQNAEVTDPDGTNAAATKSITATIVDDELANPGEVRIVAGDIQLSVDEEGNNDSTPGDGLITIRVERVNGSEGTARVELSLTPNSASPGVDYLDVVCSLTWADGDSSVRTCDVPVIDNDIVDGTRRLFASLDNAEGVSIDASASQSVINIQDNDVAVVVGQPGRIGFELAADSVSAEQGAVNVFVSRVDGTSGLQRVQYRTLDGTARSGVDYAFTQGTLSFEDGNAFGQFIAIPLLSNPTSDLTFSVQITSIDGDATIGDNPQITITIEAGDDQNAGSFGFADSSVSVSASAGTISIPVQRLGGSQGAVDVQFRTLDGTAQAGVEYTSTSGVVSFADGSTLSQFIEVPIAADANGSTSFLVELIGVSPSGSIDPSADTLTVTIVGQDQPAQGVLSFAAPRVSVDEDAGQVLVSLSRSGGDEPVSFLVQTRDGTGLAGTDYEPITEVVSFGQGENGSNTIAVTLIDNAQFRDNPSFIIEIDEASIQGSDVLGFFGQVEVTINDNDAPADTTPTIGFIQTQVGVSENADSVTLQVRRIGDSSQAVSVSAFTVENGTAVAGVDYASTSAVLNFPAGSSESQSISVPILQNSGRSADATFGVRLAPNGSSVVLNEADAVVTIRDVPDAGQPGQVTFNNLSLSLRSGETLSIPVSRVNGSAGPYTVTVSIDNPSALSVSPSFLSWPSGDDTDKTITISANETREDVQVNLAISGDNVPVLADSLAVFVLGDETTTPGNDTNLLSPLSTDLLVAETIGLFNIPISRISGDDAVSMDYFFRSVSAQGGRDFQPVAGSLTWPAGDLSIRAIPVEIFNQPNVTANGSFEVVLVNPSDNALFVELNDDREIIDQGEQLVVTVNIRDVPPVLNLPGTISFTRASYSLSANSSREVCVQRIGGSSGPATVEVTSQDGTAISGTDYVDVNATITFADGQDGEQCLTVVSLEDAFQDDKNFRLSLSVTAGNAGTGNPSSAVVSIRYGSSGSLGWLFLLLSTLGLRHYRQFHARLIS